MTQALSITGLVLAGGVALAQGASPAVARDMALCGPVMPAGAASHDCYCAPEANLSDAQLGASRLVGSNPYSLDSTPCFAAVHAGVIDRASGGPITLTRHGPVAAFVSTTSGGLRSDGIEWPGRFAAQHSMIVSGPGGPQTVALGNLIPDGVPICDSFMPQGLEQFSCYCTGNLLMNGLHVTGNFPVYAGNSILCNAAIHAGAVGEGGGVVHFASAGEVSGLTGGPPRNGITPNDIAFFPYSFTILARAPEGGGQAPTVVAGADQPVPAAPRPQPQSKPQPKPQSKPAPTPARLPVCGAFGMPDGVDSHLCLCDPDNPHLSDIQARNMRVVGSNPYTSYSDTCFAAIHAGVIDRDTGGPVMLTRHEGQEVFFATTANGITSKSAAVEIRVSPLPGAKVDRKLIEPDSVIISGPGGPDTVTLFNSNPEGYPRCGPYMPPDTQHYSCACTGVIQAQGNFVTGNGPVYAGNNHLCNTAIHAGVVGEGGGVAHFTLGPAARNLEGGQTRNGITPKAFAYYPTSLTVSATPPVITAPEPAPAPQPGDDVPVCKLMMPDDDSIETYSCRCEGFDEGWDMALGSDPYSADSNLCISAVHAGVLGADGTGVITVRRLPGQDEYLPSEANGIQSEHDDAAPFSFSFVR